MTTAPRTRTTTAARTSRKKPVGRKPSTKRHRPPTDDQPAKLTTPTMPADLPASDPPETEALAPDRAAVVLRLWRAAEAQVRQIESRMGAERTPSARESDARVLAVLSRTLRELIAMDAACQTATPQDEAADDDAPFDLDGFRRELESRLQTLREQRSDSGDRQLS